MPEAALPGMAQTWGSVAIALLLSFLNLQGSKRTDNLPKDVFSGDLDWWLY